MDVGYLLVYVEHLGSSKYPMYYISAHLFVYTVIGVFSLSLSLSLSLSI